MSQWILLNAVTVGTLLALPGTIYDDTVVDITKIQAAQGVLWPQSDATVAAAAKYVQAAHKNRGMAAADMGVLMTASALSSLRSTGSTLTSGLAAFQGGTGAEQTQKLVIDVPLAAIQAATSAAAFDIGAPLPTNARLISAELDVITPTTGGTLSAMTASVQGTGDAAGSILAAVSVFTGAAAANSKPGSNPYPNRSGQQLRMVLTATGDTCANVTAGHLSVVVFYEIVP